MPEYWTLQHSGIFRNDPGIFRYTQKPVKPQYIQNPGIFRTLAYLEPLHIRNPGIFRTLPYLEYWHMHNSGMFWYIQNSGIYRTLAHSEPRYFQKPGLSRTLSLFRTLAHWELWYIQNSVIFWTRAIFSTLVYSPSQAYSQPCQTFAIECFTKIMQILYCTIFKYGKLKPKRDRSQ